MKALAFCVLAACAAELKPVPGKVGAACSDSEPCARDLVCETRLPGGACTFDCTTCNECCPSGAVCIRVSYPGEAVGVSRCLATCNETVECREAWNCAPASDGTTVCIP